MIVTDNQADNTPQVVLSLLRQLVYKAGVPQEDITYGDTSRYIPNKIFNKCHAEFPMWCMRKLISI